MKTHAFNERVSNTLESDRDVPDTRNPVCKKETYPDVKSLPTVRALRRRLRAWPLVICGQCRPVWALWWMVPFLVDGPVLGLVAAYFPPLIGLMLLVRIWLCRNAIIRCL